MAHKYFVFLLSLILLSCQSKINSIKTSSVIDIQTEADSLTILGEGVISTSLNERDIAINPQGDEIVYTLFDYRAIHRCLVIVRKVNEVWTSPEIMSISGKYRDIEPFYSNNGNRLYFVSNRPIYNDSTRNDYNIWFSDKIDGAWSEPEALDSIINTRGNEFYPSLSEKGNLFFTATRGYGIGGEDVFMSEFEEGRFTLPKALPTEINSTLGEFNAYISPKEDILIFGSFGRDGEIGGGDLYISRKDENGKWSQSKIMGGPVNSDRLDYCPFIDWKTRNFYFTSERISPNDIEVKNVDSLMKIASSTLNGFGNIYKIGLDKLDEFN